MKKTGSMNHVRFTVSDIPHAESFYDPLLGYMGYELAERLLRLTSVLNSNVGRSEACRQGIVRALWGEASSMGAAGSCRTIRSVLQG
jgi:hypothetical protein